MIKSAKAWNEILKVVIIVQHAERNPKVDKSRQELLKLTKSCQIRVIKS